MGRTKTKLNAPHVTYSATYNVPQQLINRDKQKSEKNSRKNCWEQFLDFQQGNLSKFEKIHAF